MSEEELEYFLALEESEYEDMANAATQAQANALVKECRANADALDAWGDNAERNGYRIR